ncbi:MAG: hypothetical protein V5A68_06975 [Candidatus Thermoplasmatota archaeon]
MEFLAIIGFISLLLAAVVIFLTLKSRNQFFENAKKEYRTLKQEYDTLKNSFDSKKIECVKLNKNNKFLSDKVKDYEKHLDKKMLPLKNSLQQLKEENQELLEKINLLSENKKEIHDRLKEKEQVLFNKDYDAALMENKYRRMLDQIQNFRNLDSYQRILRETFILRLFCEQKQVLFREIKDCFPGMSDMVIRRHLKHLEKLGLVNHRMKGVYQRGTGVPADLKKVESFDFLLKIIVGCDLRQLEEILS